MRQHLKFYMVAIAMAMALTMCVATTKSTPPDPTDLGVLDGFTNSMAVAANASGQVVGACFSGFMGGQRAFLWLPEAAYGLAAGMHDLGVLDGCVSSFAVAINSHGQVIGHAWDTMGRPHAFLWLPEPAYGLDAGLNALNGLDGEVDSFARDLNDAGQIVGISGMDVGEYWLEDHVFIWQDGVATALTMANGSPIYVSDNVAGQCLTETGQVIGRYEDDTSLSEWPIRRAVLWDNGTATVLTPEGVYSEAIAINAHGEVVGRYEEAEDVFLWLPEAAYGLEAGCHLLAAEAEHFISNQIFVHGISDAGQILGRNSKGNHLVPDGPGEGEGIWVEDPGFLWVWQNGAFQQIATMNASDAAFDMNAAGQAAGYSTEIIWDEEWNISQIQRGHFWSEATGLLTLPTLGGDNIQVLGIGPDGLAVGGSSLVDNTAFHACTWAPASPPPPPSDSVLDLSDATVLVRGKNVAVQVTLTNPTATTASNTTFTTATLGDVPASGSMKVGTIKAGAGKTCTLQFKNVPAGEASLVLEGTCSLGDFSRTQTVIVP
jgi:probable HAF family extracellular repeat protein